MEVCSRYTPSRRWGVYQTVNCQCPRSRVVWFSIVRQCIMCVREHLQYCILKFDLTRLVSCIDAAFQLEKDDFEYTWSSKALPKHPCSQGRVGFMTKGLSLASTWNQDAAGTQPWASLLPSYSLKMTIVKPWFELVVEHSASQFCWQWWQQLVEYQLVLALSLE